MRDVTPLRDWQETISPPNEQSAAPVKLHRKARMIPAAKPVLAVPILPAAGFDAESERRLSAGKLAVAARLDLHGMTEAAAHKAVLAFLTRALAARHGLVLIITGKGLMGTGTLKRSLVPWLETAPALLRSRIRAVRPAAPHDGGDGAFYVLLKRK